ncbi:GNAT family N-acetyltransferase [Pseudomonas sp. HK3]
METQRLTLRQWKESDLPIYASMNANPDVMHYFPSVLTENQSNAQAQRGQLAIDKQGWGFWAVEIKASGQFIGFVGLNNIVEESGFPNAPFVEIGWRLSNDHWGKGYATEAAKESLKYAFDCLQLQKVCAFTALQNLPSRRVMEKLGMHDNKQTFYHPALAESHELSKHCLYTITKSQWAANIR